MAEKEVKITISASSRDAKRAFKEISEAAKKASDSIGAAGEKGADGMDKIRQSGKKAQDSVKGLDSALKGLGALAAASAIGSVAKSIADLGLSAIKSAAQMRQYEIAFQTMLKSAGDGTRMLQDLQKFAAETPFDVPGVVEAAQQLLAFGFNAQEIIPTLRVLGDTAAGLGKSTAGVQQIAYALGQIRTSGTLKTQDMNQLTNAGISAWEILAQAAGKSVREIKEATEKGMIDSTKAVEVLTAGMTERFGGMMEKTAQEVQGLWNNIAESVGNAQSTIGAFATDATNLKGVLQAVSDSVSGMSDKLMQARNAGKSFSEAIREAFPPELTVAVGALVAVVGVGLVGAVGAAVAAFGAFAGISAPVVAAVAALGAQLGLYFTYWEEIKGAIDFAKGALEKFIDTPIANLIPTMKEYVEEVKKAKQAHQELASYSTYDSDYHDRIAEAEKPTTNLITDEKKLSDYQKEIRKTAEEYGFQERQIRAVASAEAERKRVQEAVARATMSDAGRKQAYYESQIAAINRAKEADKEATMQKIAGMQKQKEMWEEAEAAGVDGSEGKAAALAKQIELERQLLALRQETAGLQADEIQAKIDGQEEVLSAVSQAWLDYGRSVASGFGNAVESIVTGAQSASKAFGEMVRNMLAQCVNLLAQWTAIFAMVTAWQGPKKGAQVANKMVLGLASGGYVAGPGTGTSDSIPAMLSNGEYVVRASAVRKIGVPALNAINAGRGFADGGVVDAGAFASHPVANNTKNENRTANISLNVSAVDAESFAGFLRNGGLDEIRQALFDNNRNFGDLAGVW